MRNHTSLRLAGLLLGILCAADCRRAPATSDPPPAASSAEPAAIPVAPPQPVAASPAGRPTIVPNAAAYADGGAPAGYDRASVWDVVPAGDGAAVLLLDATSTVVLPIFVGGTEALTIKLRLQGEHYQRPLTHDLLSTVLKELDAQPVKAQIDELKEDTYYGSLFMRQGDRILQLDARPSDAIAVALGSGAPLFVSHAVLLTSGVPRKDIEKDQKSNEIGKRKRGEPTSL